MDRLPPEYDATLGDDALEAAIEKRLVDIDSGRYRTTVASVLRKFAAWMQDEHGIAINAVVVTTCAKAIRSDLSCISACWSAFRHGTLSNSR